MHGEAFVFINFDQAAGFGHIGWGFFVGGDSYYFGSTDHLWNRDYPQWHPLELIRYMNVPPTQNNDFWAEFGTFDDMIRTMRRGNHVKYHAYKTLSVNGTDPLLAKAHADSQRLQGWNIITNNCVHQTYDILTKYGATALPDPYELAYRFPKAWFEHIAGEAIVIASSRNCKLAVAPSDSDSANRRAG